jgi:prolyl-tRNA synthetase
VQSWRDLPIKINQWCNVVRWEMRTRLFLRTAEFLWQEGHTAHATEAEAWEETRQMLDVYADFAENHMAMPVIKGEKTAGERFPGAVSTLSIEAMMQDRKALQAGTSHFLGQNFSRVQEIKFQDQNGREQFAWTTSWGLSTRMVGALIMTHSDDNGLCLPPRLAPKHVVILPIYRNDEERAQVMQSCDQLKQAIEKQTFGDDRLSAMIDDRDIRGGEKKWYHVKRGVPIRVEIGPRDVAGNTVFVARRDEEKSTSFPREQFVAGLPQMLESLQASLYERAKKLRADNTCRIDSLDDFCAYFTPQNADKPEIHGGFAECYFVDTPALQHLLKDMKVTIRNVPLEHNDSGGKCIFSGQAAPRRGIFAKAY